MDLLTVQETADLLRVSAVTVRRHITAGRLKAKRFGRRVRVDRDELEAFMLPASVELKGRPFTEDDPLWNLVGAFRSDEPTDIASHKDEYLAEAYADLHEDK